MSKKKLITMTLGDDEWLGVNAISFVDFPAIEVDFVTMSKSARSDKALAMLKAQMGVTKLASVNIEKGLVFGPVLIADQHILRIDEETGEEYYITYPADVVEAIAHRYSEQGKHKAATVMHEFSVPGCTVVESWVKRGNSDLSTELGFALPGIAWCVCFKVTHPDVLEDIKSGVLRGFSLEGFFMNQAKQFCKSSESDLLAEFELAVLAHASM